MDETNSEVAPENIQPDPLGDRMVRPAAEDIPTPDEQVNVIGQRRAAPAQPAIPTPADLDNQAALFADDQARGAIHAKTYHDLYADGGVPHKVGTLFGLLLGGAGGGLTHQPNVVLQMMDNEIKNDLERQKASNENSQNWLRLSQAHTLQQAQIPQVESGTALNKANTALLDTNNATNRMRLNLFQHLNDIVNKLPPGPTQQNGQALVNNVVGPAITQKIKQDNAQTVSQVQAREALADQRKANNLGVDLDKLNQLKTIGQMNSKMDVPDQPGKALSPDQSGEATKEAQTVMMNRKAADAFNDSFNKLNTLTAGKLTPEGRKAEIDTIVPMISRLTAGFYSAGDANNIAESMFPSPGDTAQTRREKYRKGMEAIQAAEAGTPVLDSLGIKQPFPYATKAPVGGQKTVKIQAPNGGGIRVVPQESAQKYIDKGGKVVQ